MEINRFSRGLPTGAATRSDARARQMAVAVSPPALHLHPVSQSYWSHAQIALRPILTRLAAAAAAA